MKHITSKLLSLLLTLAMLLSMVPAAYAADEESGEESAEEYAAFSGTTYWTTLQAAIDEGPSDIYLAKDVTEDFRVPEGKTVNLSLYGHQLHGTVTNNGNLTINRYKQDYAHPDIGGGDAIITNNGTLKLGCDGATGFIVQNNGTLNITSGATYTLSNITNGEAGTVAITGGSFDTEPLSDWLPAGYIAKNQSDGSYKVAAMRDADAKGLGYVARNATGTTQYFKTVQDALDAGVFSVYLLSGVNVVENCVMNAAGGITLSGYNSAFTGSLTCQDGWSITISSGVTAKLSNVNCYELQIGSTASTTGPVSTVTLKGGSVCKITVANKNSLTIEGGVYTGAVDVKEGGTLSISGGTFSSDVSAYLADGYTYDTETGTVKPDTTEPTGVAKIGNVYYETLEAAIEATKTGDTVTLLQNVDLGTSSIQFYNSGVENLTFDLDGHTITSAVEDYGTVVASRMGLVIKNGTIENTSTGSKDATSAIYVTGGGTTTLEDVTLFSNKSGLYVCGSITNTASVTVNIGKGTVTDGTEFGVFIEKQTKGSGTKLPQITLNINGGTINGAKDGVKVTSNSKPSTVKTNITGGIVSSVNIISLKSTYPATLEISGGTVEGTLTCNGPSVITVKDGIFNGEVKMLGTNGTITISGGTFSSAVKEEYCADGYVPKNNGNGTYGVEANTPIEVWTGYTGTKAASYDTIAAAVENLGENKWIVVAKDYTLTDHFTIPEGVYLDVANGATLTVNDGVTLTVAADAKRLGVRTGATLVNNGTILVCGSNTTNGFAMLYGTFSGNALTVPEDCFLDNNGKNFFAAAESDAVYEITFSDGSVKKTADSTNIEGGNVTQIKLLGDVTKGGWTLDNSSVGPEVTLDLNGHTLSYDGANPYYATLNVYTKVTIKNGTVKYTGSKRGAIDLVGQGDLTIESDVVVDGGDAFGIFTSGTSKLTVNGTVKANGNYAIAGNGSETAGNIDSIDVTINDGAVVSAPKGLAIYHPQLGTVTVNGGEISGHTGIEMCAGKLVVNDGSITSTGDNWDAAGSQNAILDGAAISIINRNYPGGVPTAEINGGTIKATGNGAQTVKAYDYTNNAVAEWTAAGTYVNITGGTFGSIPTNMDALCAEGYIPMENTDGTYGVRKATYVAEYNGTKYESLAEAFAAAQDGQTVTLLTGITVEGPKGLSVTVGDGKQQAPNVTFDLNGHSITGSGLGATEAALTIMAGYSRSNWLGSVTITNSAEIEAKISAKLPLKITASGYADAVKVVVEDNVNLDVQDGGTNAIFLKNNVYLPATVESKSFYKDGGFLVTANDGDRIYQSVAGAQKAGKEITLLNDTTQQDPINLSKNWGSVTLDLDGHSYYAAGSYVFGTNDAGVNFTIKNGTVKSGSGKPFYINQSNSTVTIEEVTIETVGEYAVVTHGNDDNNVITLTNCTIKAPNGTGVYFPSGGTLAITGGKINAKNGVQICAGSLTVDGTEITATGDNELADKTGDGSTEDGAAISIVKRPGYKALGEVKIVGGIFTAKDGNDALMAYDWENNAASKFTESDKVGVSGGTFSSAVKEEYCAAGYIPTTNENGTYTVKVGSYVAEVNGTKYESLADAVEAAQNGGTVTLLSDIDLDKQIATGKAITIDGQSKYTIKATTTIVGTDNKKSGMFYRTTSAQGTLTFLNVTLDGNGLSQIFLNEGGAGETVFDGVTSTNGGGIAYGSGIHISGGGSHATIKNSTLTGSTGTDSGNYWDANDLWVGGNVYVTVENSTIGTVFVNSAPSATATNGVVHGQLTITGENTKITYLSGEEEAAEKLDKFGNNGSLVKIDSGYVEKIFDKGSYEISGGTFKTEVKPEWCAFTYVPAGPDADGLYTVEKSTAEAQIVGTQTFGTLTDMLAQSANGQTVALVNDATVNNWYFAVAPGKTIDLNGNKLTVTGKLYSFGKVIDSTEGEGLLSVTDMAGSQLPKDNGYLPIKDGDGYRLYKYEFAAYGTKASDDKNSVMFAVQLEFTNLEAWDKIKADKNSVQLTYLAEWNGNKSIFSFKHSTLAGIAGKATAEKPTAYFTMTISGFNSLNLDSAEFKMTPQLECAFFTHSVDTQTYTIGG